MSFKKRVLLCVSLCAFVLVSACAPALTQQEIRDAEYGRPIQQEQAQALASNYLAQTLLDPYSAQVQWGAVHRGYIIEAPIHGGGYRFGYRLQASVNAKNAFGGYVGARAYSFLFYNGALDLVYADEVLSATGALVHMRQYSRR